MTTILPPVRDDRPDHLRDPIEEVKAALGGRSSDRDPERDPLEMATAALEGKTPLRHQQPTGGPRGGRPPLPDWGWLQRIDWSRLDHINWT
ncbi:MAG: penicillin-binding protein, partial [Mycobacterium sp.]